MSKQIFADRTASKSIESVSGLLSLIREKKDFAPIYRGQSNIDWGLTPTIARPNFNFSGFFKRGLLIKSNSGTYFIIFIGLKSESLVSMIFQPYLLFLIFKNIIKFVILFLTIFLILFIL